MDRQVRMFINIRKSNAEKTAEELRERYERLHPKLDQLREVRQHLDDFFIAKASEAAHVLVEWV